MHRLENKLQILAGKKRCQWPVFALRNPSILWHSVAGERKPALRSSAASRAKQQLSTCAAWPALCQVEGFAMSKYQTPIVVALRVLLSLLVICSGLWQSSLSSYAAPPPATTIVMRQTDVAATTGTANFRLYLPVVANEPIGCRFNQPEKALATLLTSDPHQQRTAVVCNPILAEVARQRAEDMANRDYFSHTNPDGVGPNYLVRAAGYPLPDYYNQKLSANNVESITAGHATAAEAWTAFLQSQQHRNHLLGENSFYADQHEFGIGYAERKASDYQYYWVVITAESE